MDKAAKRLIYLAKIQTNKSIDTYINKLIQERY